jgi:hypothetical protein
MRDMLRNPQVKCQPVVESSLGGGQKSILKAAELAHFYTVVTVAPGFSLAVRGWSGDRRFVALYDIRTEGKATAHRAYWWTRELEVTAELPTQVVRWSVEKPVPVAVSFRELKRLLLPRK